MNGAKAEAQVGASNTLRRRFDASLHWIEALPSARVTSVENLAFAFCLVLFAVSPWLVEYFTTNDGPVHVAMMIVLAKLGQPGFELTNAFYRSNVGPEPNWIAYVLLDGLLRVFSPHAAEKIIQFIVLVSLPLAARYAVSFRGPQTWLALAAFPFAFNQMFFLGLYNFCLSLSLFCVFMGVILRSAATTRHYRGVMHWLSVTVLLLLLFFSHAMAYATAMIALAAMVIYEVGHVLLDRTQSWRARFAHVTPTLLYWASATIPVFILFVSYYLRHRESDAWYGFPWHARILHILDLGILVRQFRFDPLVSHIFQLALGAAILFAAMKRWQDSKLKQGHPAVSDALLFVFLCCIGIAMAIFDVSGGGWTHYRRAVLFVYLSAFLWIAAFPAAKVMRLGFTGATAFATLMLWVSMMYSQTLASAQTAELMSVAPHIRNHSTIAPIIYNWAGVDERDKPITAHYQPFFQGASRLGYEGDRVVLFSYNARLDVYPVKFREEMDPHPTLFSWGEDSKKMDVFYLNIEWFERASGHQLDYIVTFGRPTEESFRLLSDLVQERIKEFSFRKVFTSPTGLVTLYERTPATK